VEHECKHDDKIASITNKMQVIESRQMDIQLKVVETQGDVKHIKTRIDNGMSHTIASIHEKLTLLSPVIDHHKDIVKRIEGIGWTLATSLILALIAYMAWGISVGFKLPS
jgi:hypothetical protein